jgi:hypothetical protein
VLTAAIVESKRPTLLVMLTAAVLLAAGCGGSSTKATTSSATASHSGSAASSTAASTPSSATSTAPGTAPAATSSTNGPIVTASAGGLTATMHTSGHHPKVNRPWPIQFTVTRGGRPVRASVAYEYLFAGQVVAHRSHYTFTGHFSDVFIWPSASVGYPLTFRAVIVSGATMLNLDYAVQVST